MTSFLVVVFLLRLPFGIKCATEIFQRIVDNMLEGIDGAQAVTDDILRAAMFRLLFPILQYRVQVSGTWKFPQICLQKKYKSLPWI